MRCSRGLLLLAAAALLGSIAPVRASDPEFVAPLRQAYADSAERLRNSPFQRPLYLESSEREGTLEGSIHALMERPFADVERALSEPAHWCELLILMPNISDCRPRVTEQQPTRLAIGLVRRVDAPREAMMPVEFSFERADSAGGLEVRLAADRGPLGTHDYRIVLDAIPIDDGRSFLHLRYAYRYGLSARLAAQAYFATSGSDKIGFSLAGRDAEGRPRYVGGLRGAVERNAMRCYLAIDAYLGSAARPAPARFEATLQRWIEASRQYRPLQEDDLGVYAAAKRRAYQQQRAPA